MIVDRDRKQYVPWPALTAVSGFLFVAVCLVAGCSVESDHAILHQALSQTEQNGALAGESPESDDSAEAAGVGGKRRLIYTAQLHLVVESFAEVETQIPQLVAKHGGFLSQVTVDRTSGEYRSGHWQVRIPVDQFELFLDQLSSLGIPHSRSQSAQDVTEEFVDLQARIANKRRLEKRILELLEKSGDAIKDVIEVERELARVRGEIEQMEGRLRYLTDRTDLTTIDVYARAASDYVPPQAMSFAGRVKFAWNTSLAMLHEFFTRLGVFIVYLIPWVVAGLVIIGPLLWLIRRRQRHRVMSTVKPPDEG